MKTLITGGAGFIGSHIADRLLTEGHEVRILDNLEPRVHPKGRPPWLPRDAEFIIGDVRDRDTMTEALKGVHVVFHEAAYQDYMPDFSTFFHVNSVSMAMIHEIILEQKRNRVNIKNSACHVEKIVVASSQAVYGEGQYRCINRNCFEPFTDLIQPENRTQDQLQKGQWEILCPQCGEPMINLKSKEAYHNPYNAYAISKLAEEMVAVRLGKLHSIPTVALRYSIVQGPRQSLYNQYSGICRIFCARLINNLPPIIYEDGRQKRDYTHIKDVVEANIAVLKDHRADYQVFNVGSDLETTVREYAEILCSKLDTDIEPVIRNEYRVGDNRHSVSDISKLKGLGWFPRYGLEEILDDYMAWIQNQSEIRGFFEEAEKAMRDRGVVMRAESLLKTNHESPS